uniref:Uncharacterized protein n=1 Tax=Palpitomonas bilix TaxID=652834 RepID=A0A7S3DDQ0_9EUKA|mmetsp:Transcript_3239/g.6280  ORF Transcript_3239/g.6280 Transcript_3239/m.6280 type:complete len:204 (+) Transcript_3239:2-613(+)
MKVIVFIAVSLCVQHAYAGINFDDLAQATLTGILGDTPNPPQPGTCSDWLSSKGLPTQCLSNVMVLTSPSGNLFFIPWSVKYDPTCFDDAQQGGPMEGDFGPRQSATTFFKSAGIHGSFSLAQYNMYVLFNSGDRTCKNYMDLKAGKLDEAKCISGQDVTDQDVQEWKQIISNNMDMLKQKYGGSMGALDNDQHNNATSVTLF